jgi:exopolyphosphatase/guanosine-5'-triphosphate,3'-diphosphate pyrophosphatase
MNFSTGKRLATIDIGTNSVKMLIAELTGHTSWITLADRFVVTRLGQDLGATGKIGMSAANRTIDAIASLVGETRSCGVETIAAVGTMCLRTATNGDHIAGLITRETGIPVDIISGEREAFLGFRAATFEEEGSSNVHTVFDVGGGSTEIISGHGSSVTTSLSLDVGAVDLMQVFHLHRKITTKNIPEIDAYLSNAFPPFISTGTAVPRNEYLIGIGGTITTLGAMHYAVEPYDPIRIHKKSLSLSQIDALIRLLTGKNAKDRSRITGLPRSRADIILSGAFIVRNLIEKLGMNECIINTWGLRHGILIDRFL